MSDLRVWREEPWHERQRQEWVQPASDRRASDHKMRLAARALDDAATVAASVGAADQLKHAIAGHDPAEFRAGL